MSRVKLMKKIGEGGQGKVYVAAYVKDPKHNKIVSAAVKEVPVSKADMEEVRLQAKLSLHPKCHRYIACLYDVFQRGKNKLIVMELIKGKELWDFVVEHDGPLGLHILKTFFRQALKGLAFIHANGIAHGDIKLENFMVDTQKHDDPVLKYIDFGYGCSEKTCASSPVLHATSYLLPPEAFTNETIWSRRLAVPDWVKSRIAAKADGSKTLQGIQKADLWALGSTFAELLMSLGNGQLIRTEAVGMTGKHLMHEDPRTWLASEHMSRRRFKRSMAYDRLYAVVDSLMKIDPDDRLTPVEALELLMAQR